MVHNETDLQKRIEKINDCSLVAYLVTCGYRPVGFTDDVTIDYRYPEANYWPPAVVDNETNRAQLTMTITEGTILDLVSLLFRAEPREILSNPERYHLNQISRTDSLQITVDNEMHVVKKSPAWQKQIDAANEYSIFNYLSSCGYDLVHAGDDLVLFVLPLDNHVRAKVVVNLKTNRFELTAAIPAATILDLASLHFRASAEEILIDPLDYNLPPPEEATDGNRSSKQP